MEEYSVIRIKKSTKELIDKEKQETGKLLWFIVDEAIKQYVSNNENE